MVEINGKNNNTIRVSDLVKKIHIQGENKRKCTRYCTKLLQELNPSTEIEKILAQKIIFEGWKIQRLTELETAYIDKQIGHALNNLIEYETSMEKKAVRKLVKVRINSPELQELHSQQVALEKAFSKDLKQYRSEQNNSLRK